ncbi:MAG: hypothetical protein JOZ93_19690 [Sinobacteraceae bacterium]|nr:hypothetical protein [Nevskiaceae bacterium]
MLEFVPGQLVSGQSSAAPHRMLSSAALGSPQGVVFDAHGNLWVLDPGGLIKGKATPALFEFTAAQLNALASDPAPMPAASITSTYLKYPAAAVFDLSGNLWLTDQAANTLLVFSAAQLAQSGANELNPSMVLSSSALHGPAGLAFDAGGNMWIAMHGQAATAMTAAVPGTTVVQFDLSTLPPLPDGGTLTDLLAANITLTADAQGSIQAPWALSFDSAGDLWVSDSGSSARLVSFAKGDLAQSGTPTPSVILSATNVGSVASFAAPHGICFDDIEALAVTSSAGTFAAAYYAPNQLSSGAPVPYTLLTGAATKLQSPAGCTFGNVAP